MSGTIPIIAQPNELSMAFCPDISLSSNTSMLPLEGSSLLFDSTLNDEQQAESILRQMGRDIPEKVCSQVAEMPQRSPIYDELLSQINTPEGLQKFKEYQKTDNEKIISELKTQEKAVNREFLRSADQYEIAIKPIYTKIKTDDMDGRSHISAIYYTIDNINSNYQKSFGEITKNATKFMEKVNNALGKISSYISAGSDGKIHFKKNDFLVEFKKNFSDMIWTDFVWGIELKVDNIDNCVKPIASFNSKPGMYDFFSKKLSGQGFFVKEFGGEVHIYPDFNPVIQILSTVDSSLAGAGGDIMSQAFQSMQTALDSKKNAVNNSISRLLETFRQDNSHFETLTQLLIQLLKDLFQYNAGFANT